MIALSLTPQEADNMRALLDAAVRGSGMQAAVMAVPLMEKLLAAAQALNAEQQATTPTRSRGKRKPPSGG